jgi:hypothetical protein
MDVKHKIFMSPPVLALLTNIISVITSRRMKREGHGRDDKSIQREREEYQPRAEL